MKTITTHEAKTHLSRYLAEIEAGGEFIIARGNKPIARLCSLGPARRRPKVGEMLDRPMHVPDEALAPLTSEELKGWGI